MIIASLCVCPLNPIGGGAALLRPIGRYIRIDSHFGCIYRLFSCHIVRGGGAGIYLYFGAPALSNWICVLQTGFANASYWQGYF